MISIEHTIHISCEEFSGTLPKSSKSFRVEPEEQRKTSGKQPVFPATPEGFRHFLKTHSLNATILNTTSIRKEIMRGWQSGQMRKLQELVS